MVNGIHMLKTLQLTIREGRWGHTLFVVCLMVFCIDLVFLQHGRIGSTDGVSIRQIIFLLLNDFRCLPPDQFSPDTSICGGRAVDAGGVSPHLSPQA